MDAFLVPEERLLLSAEEGRYTQGRIWLYKKLIHTEVIFRKLCWTFVGQSMV